MAFKDTVSHALVLAGLVAAVSLTGRFAQAQVTSSQEPMARQQPAEVQSCDRAYGFSDSACTAIDKARQLILAEYDLPSLLFIKNEEIEAGGMLKEAEAPRHAGQEGLGKGPDYVVLLHDYPFYQQSFSEEAATAIDQRWFVPYDRPMVAVVIHEIGHSFFEQLALQEQRDIGAAFQGLDDMLTDTGKPSHVGHASYYSYFWNLTGNTEPEYTQRAVNEQFAEAFTYHVLGSSYMAGDAVFEKKLDTVVASLEHLERDQSVHAIEAQQ